VASTRLSPSAIVEKTASDIGNISWILTVGNAIGVGVVVSGGLVVGGLVLGELGCVVLVGAVVGVGGLVLGELGCVVLVGAVVGVGVVGGRGLEAVDIGFVEWGAGTITTTGCVIVSTVTPDDTRPVLIFSVTEVEFCSIGLSLATTTVVCSTMVVPTTLMVTFTFKEDTFNERATAATYASLI
jgi:hypothetical protein